MSDCNHKWIANEGAGGVPVFTPEPQLGPMPFMMVRCSECGEKLYMTMGQWEKLGVKTGAVAIVKKEPSWLDRFLNWGRR